MMSFAMRSVPMAFSTGLSLFKAFKADTPFISVQFKSRPARLVRRALLPMGSHYLIARVRILAEFIYLKR